MTLLRVLHRSSRRDCSPCPMGRYAHREGQRRPAPDDSWNHQTKMTIFNALHEYFEIFETCSQRSGAVGENVELRDLNPMMVKKVKMGLPTGNVVLLQWPHCRSGDSHDALRGQATPVTGTCARCPLVCVLSLRGLPFGFPFRGMHDYPDRGNQGQTPAFGTESR